MQKLRKSKVAIAVRTTLMAMSGVVAVQAQEAPPAQEAPQAQGTLQEIKVTANKYRPDDQTTATGLRLKLIDTPQSISVVDQAILTQFNAQSAYDAADMVPGVSQGAQAFGIERLTVRGQFLTAPRINGMNILQEEFVDAFALERIEFVRGPATVLYGTTAAFGGEINQILKRPLPDYRASVAYDAGSFAQRRLEADVTGPVPGTDSHLKVRVAGAYSTSGIPQDVPVKDTSKMLLLAATYDFDPDTQVGLYAYGSDRSYDPTDGCPMAQNASAQLYIPTSIPTDRWYCNDPRNSFGGWRNEFELGSITHSFANDWTVDARVARETVKRTSNYVYGFGPAGAGGLPPTDVSLYSYADREQQSNVTADLSLNGKFTLFGETQQFLAALEHQTQNYARAHFASFGLGTLNMFEDGGLGILADGSPIPPVPSPDPYTDSQVSKETDLRGSVQLLLTPYNRWQILIGALTQHSNESNGTVPASGPAAAPATLVQTHTVKRLAITYSLLGEKGRVLTDAKTYFNYSEGIVPVVGVFTATGVPLTLPEREKSYEVGLKTEWLNGQLSASVAGYNSYVLNSPEVSFTAPTGGSSGFFSSVETGRDTYDGLEFELVGQVIPGWNVEFNYSYIRALLNSPLLGTTLYIANVPKQQAGFFTGYQFQTGRLRGLLVGMSVVNKDHSPLIDNDVEFYSGHYDPRNQLFQDFTKVDFNASYTVLSGRLEGLELFANLYNAFNARTFYSLQYTPAYSNPVSRPREWVAGVRYQFKP